MSSQNTTPDMIKVIAKPIPNTTHTGWRASIIIIADGKPSDRIVDDMNVFKKRYFALERSKEMAEDFSSKLQDRLTQLVKLYAERSKPT